MHMDKMFSQDDHLYLRFAGHFDQKSMHCLDFCLLSYYVLSSWFKSLLYYFYYFERDQ